MKPNYLKNKIGSAILGIALLLGIGLASSTNVQAQWQDDRWERQQRQQQRQYEREQRRRQREYERQRRQQQRRADQYGYGNTGYGNDGYGYYGGSYEMRQTALNAGYNEGREAGREDRSRGERYNYADEGEYRDADKDYNSRYGDRNLYRQYFRQGFVNGYTDGYRGY